MVFLTDADIQFEVSEIVSLLAVIAKSMVELAGSD